MNEPVVIYCNWASYDELSDKVELTEKLAMEQFENLLRLRDRGCRFDVYLMDAFWYAKDGAYRQWRQPHWPKGPDRWLAACRRHGVTPGLWLGSNSIGDFLGLSLHPAWEDSVNASRTACSWFEGGFRAHVFDTLELHYGQGVRLWKWDFQQLHAVTPRSERELLPSEIRARNIEGFVSMLEQFRARHPDVVFLGYNGLEETFSDVSPQSTTGHPVRRVLPLRFLDGMDAVYCGDPRPADVPCANFWRSKDIYSDHLVRYYAVGGVPLHRIDNSGFMIGTTGTCYYRGKAGWKGMLLLALMRGGWANTVYGNLDLLDDADAAWFAKAQSLVLPLQESGSWSLFGGTPGLVEPYGFRAGSPDGALFAAVNPGQCQATVALPDCKGDVRVLFHDPGFVPAVEPGGILSLGAEQMAVVGSGVFATPAHDLGIGDGPAIPASLRTVVVQPIEGSNHHLRAWVPIAGLPRSGRLRLILKQWRKDGLPLRTSGGAPPDGFLLGETFHISVEQDSEPVATTCTCDRKVWSGLSWWLVQVDLGALRSQHPLRVLARAAPDAHRVALEAFVAS